MKNWQYGKRVHEYTHEMFLSREWGCNQAPFSRLKIAFQYLNSWVTQLFRQGPNFKLKEAASTFYFMNHEKHCKEEEEFHQVISLEAML